MCGIFGYVHRNPTDLSFNDFSRKLDKLFILSQTRGKEAAGLCLATDTKLLAYKDSTVASEMIRSADYQAFLRRAWAARSDAAAPLACIGHTRLVTNGSQVIDANNQPVRRGRVVLVHNGIITNCDHVWRIAALEQQGDVDTQSAAAVLESQLSKGATPEEAASVMMQAIYGESTFAGLFADRTIMLLATNTGSMFMCLSADGDEFFFVSERVIAQKAAKAAEFSECADSKVRQVKPGDIVCFNYATMTETVRRVGGGDLAAPNCAAGLLDMRAIEEKAEHNAALRAQMRRCSRCLLPETMPFIAYDDSGICNYCRGYRRIELKGRDALERHLTKLRLHPGEPDCILSFSGGRDSSYGLHLLVRELGLKPVAFSYDWGMVTDLGRRNQARMCHALGVEHIWISADIKAKRANIRSNVLAWMKRPRLGTVPLFMAGDKHFFYHANQTMKQTGIGDLFMCINQMERTDFKVGFADTMPKSLREYVEADHVHSLPFGAVASMLAYYARETILNPAYINRSLLDTSSGFVSYYLMKQPHIDIFEYLPWHEVEVERVLQEYKWEYADDAATSWRIGDGTAPFYNYIYYEAAGFTEFDTLRSNQIREGQITREEGLRLIHRDNQPRWESIREYCHLINVSFEDCMRAVNKLPKLYDRAGATRT
jgi:glucosamine--fructose-6-phosphate aminotransferase (isomerizing)